MLWKSHPKDSGLGEARGGFPSLTSCALRNSLVWGCFYLSLLRSFGLVQHCLLSLSSHTSRKKKKEKIRNTHTRALIINVCNGGEDKRERNPHVCWVKPGKGGRRKWKYRRKLHILGAGNLSTLVPETRLSQESAPLTWSEFGSSSRLEPQSWGPHEPPGLAKFASSSFSEKSCLKTLRWRTLKKIKKIPDVTSSLHTHKDTFVHPHIFTHTHTTHVHTNQNKDLLQWPLVLLWIRIK